MKDGLFFPSWGWDKRTQVREERTLGNMMPSLTFKWNVFVLVWCGLVWFGLCGVFWCDVVWFGVAWFGVVWCGVVWCVVWSGVVCFATSPAPKLRVEGLSPRARWGPIRTALPHSGPCQAPSWLLLEPRWLPSTNGRNASFLQSVSLSLGNQRSRAHAPRSQPLWQQLLYLLPEADPSVLRASIWQALSCPLEPRFPVRPLLRLLSSFSPRLPCPLCSSSQWAHRHTNGNFSSHPNGHRQISTLLVIDTEEQLIGDFFLF